MGALPLYVRMVYSSETLPDCWVLLRKIPYLMKTRKLQKSIDVFSVA